MTAFVSHQNQNSRRSLLTSPHVPSSHSHLLGATSVLHTNPSRLPTPYSISLDSLPGLISPHHAAPISLIGSIPQGIRAPLELPLQTSISGLCLPLPTPLKSYPSSEAESGYTVLIEDLLCAVSRTSITTYSRNQIQTNKFW